MERKIIQKIYKCSECGNTPEDGEFLWNMCGWGVICESCMKRGMIHLAIEMNLEIKNPTGECK